MDARCYHHASVTLRFIYLKLALNCGGCVRIENEH